MSDELAERLLSSLLERAARQLEEGELTIAKPRELIEAVRLLREAGSGSRVETEIPAELLERLRNLLETGRDAGENNGEEPCPTSPPNSGSACGD